MIRLVLILALLVFPTPDPAPLRLVVMGDSITVGLGASAPDRSWAAIVAQQTRRRLVNVAIGGSRVAEQPIPSVGPGDLVIWLVGYNDARAGTNIQDFAATVTQGRTALPGVIVASGLRMTSAGYAAYGPIWNHGSEQATAAYAAAIHPDIDLSGVEPTPTVDLVHPNDAQHAAIAQTILAGLTPLAASWVNDRLIVTSAPGCLYLVGNGRLSQWIGCDLPEYVLLPYGDQGYVPMGRVLVLVQGQEQTRLDVPSRVVKYLPMVAN